MSERYQRGEPLAKAAQRLRELADEAPAKEAAARLAVQKATAPEVASKERYLSDLDFRERVNAAVQRENDERIRQTGLRFTSSEYDAAVFEAALAMYVLETG